MNAKPKILILSLYSGENEFAACKQALEGQSYTNWNLQTIENKPNLEAHHTLYKTIMERSGEYDMFIKLDADMVLCDDRALERVVGCFNARKGIDHIIFAVHDFLPDRLSLGMHVFSNRVRWNLADESLFVDPNPECPGEKIVYWDEVKTIAYHACDPLPYHAFHFGLHRGLKAFQWGRINVNPQAIDMWAALESTWDHFTRTGDIRPGLAMMGAEMARTKKIGAHGAEKNSPEAKILFDKISSMSAEQMRARLAPFWAKKLWRRAYWYTLVFARALPGGLYRRSLRMLKTLTAKGKS